MLPGAAEAEVTPTTGIGALRARDARDLAAMVVAVQHDLAADPADHRLEGGRVGQALEARSRW